MRHDPRFKGGDVSKVAPFVSKLWQELPDAEKQKYLKPARAELSAWQAAYSEYREKHERNWNKPPGMPRRVVTPYFFFAEEHWQKNQDLLIFLFF